MDNYYVDEQKKDDKPKKKLSVFTIVCFILFSVYCSYNFVRNEFILPPNNNYLNRYFKDKDFGYMMKYRLYECIAGSTTLNAVGYTYIMKGEYDRALPFIFKSAYGGSMRGQNNLGCMYLNGEGLEVNYESALYWFKKAVEQGHPNAMGNIESMYKVGLISENDFKESVEMYKKSQITR